MFGFIKNLVKKSDNNFFLELKEEVETKIDEAKHQIKEVKETVETKAKQLDSSSAEPASVTVKPTAADRNGKIPRKDAVPAAKEAKADKAPDAAQVIAKATAKKQQSLEPDEKNFATKYLMTPSSNGRRRPGANMNSYLEMARQVKTPNSNK